MTDSLPEGAKEKALRILERRDVSRAELISKLTDKGESPEAAEAVADRFVELGVIDDARYAAMVVRHCAGKGYGRQRIQNELYRRGIDKALWDEALEQLPDQEEMIDKLFRSKLKSADPDRGEIKRACDALLRRGFTWPEISDARNRVLGSYDD